jgi:SAM-dependent methyltransferase
VQTVLEFGCGDGNQLRLGEYPSYLGIDVSRTAIRLSTEAFSHDPSKSFLLYDPRAFVDPARFIRADLALSLDVVFHLVEDDVFDGYMSALFNSADRFVIVYGRSEATREVAPHVRYRDFTHWVDQQLAADWKLVEVKSAPIEGYQDFYVFARRQSEDEGAAIASTG